MANDNENDTNTGSPATERAESISANSKPRYWICASGGQYGDHWKEFYEAGIMAVGWDELGDLSTYHNQTEIKKKFKEHNGPEKSAGMAWNFCREVRPGDIVFARMGTKQIIGRGVVTGDYKFDKERKYYKHTRKVEWKLFPDGEAVRSSFNAAPRTLSEIKEEKDQKLLEALFNGTTVAQDVHNQEDASVQEEADNQDKTEGYSVDDFLNEVYLGKGETKEEADVDGKKKYDTLVRLLKNRKNIILQGPPGVGKTFAARRLAYAMMSKKDKDRVEFVQFHQSYSYEDFVEGYKPRDEGKAKGTNEEIEEKTQTSSEEKKSEFELRKGTFHEFCKKAREKEEAYKAAPDDKDNWYFFIIDEINRGNTSKIFGELLMLIENDHRGETTKLAYSREDFSVPENLFIIGMMNTADRSLAMIDYALRRRFAFVDMEPAFDSYGFGKYQKELLEKCQDENESKIFGKLIDWVKALNEEIKKDESLGEGFCIGHSYFCGWDKHEDYLKNKDDPTELKTILEGKMQDVVECDIIPALEEYWFDNKDRVKDFVNGKDEGDKKIVGLPDKLQKRLGGKYAPSEGDNGK